MNTAKVISLKYEEASISEGKIATCIDPFFAWSKWDMKSDLARLKPINKQHLSLLMLCKNGLKSIIIILDIFNTKVLKV